MTIANGAVYVVKAGIDNGYIACLDLYTGQPYWQSPAFLGAAMPPLLVGDRLFSLDEHGSLMGLDAGQGRLLWYQHHFGSRLTALAFSNNVVYQWNGQVLTAVSPVTGHRIWSVDTRRDDIAWGTFPVISDQVALVSGRRSLWAISLATKLVLWNEQGRYDAPDSQQNNPAVADGAAYIIQNGELRVRNLYTGALLWTFSAGDGDDELRNMPVIAGDYVYVASRTNTYVLNRITQELEWQVDGGGWLAVTGGQLYIAGSDRVISAYLAQEP